MLYFSIKIDNMQTVTLLHKITKYLNRDLIHNADWRTTKTKWAFNVANNWVYWCKDSLECVHHRLPQRWQWQILRLQSWDCLNTYRDKQKLVLSNCIQIMRWSLEVQVRLSYFYLFFTCAIRIIYHYFPKATLI